MKTIFHFFLISIMAAGMQCTRHDKSGSNAQGSHPDAPTTATVNNKDLKIDSLEVLKYLSYEEKNEIGPSIKRFYKNRGFKLAWWDGSKLSGYVPLFITHLKNADAEGLNPDDYNTAQLEQEYNAVKDADLSNEENQQKAADLDVKLTSAFGNYAIDMKEGITRAQKEAIGWYVKESPIRYDALLDSLFHSNEKDPFVLLEPHHPQYQQLKTILAEYRAMEKKGGWPILTGITKLKKGDTSEKVIQLRERLIMTSDLQTGAANFYNPKIFDANLELAVKNFQTRHGIDPDGVVGGSTLEAMNISLHDRITQVIVNMERWRQVPDFGPEYFFVNIPEFKLHVFDNSKPAFDMRVIVGKDFKATPIFSNYIQNVVFSPYWNIPKSIIEEEILPGMEKDPAYLERHNMEAMKGFAKDAMPVKYWEVPWYNIDDDNFQYWIRQKPGEDNPLGLVKFLFPNTFNVYLHGTDHEQLFKYVKRSFSHGCIRVEDPFKIAKYVLRDQPEWTDDRIRDAMHGGDEQWVKSRHIPVFILYFTAWRSADGKIQLRDDLYGLDQTTAGQMNS
jgi:murein L,D-transpeptidase YcbB/YkuD